MRNMKMKKVSWGIFSSILGMLLIVVIFGMQVNAEQKGTWKQNESGWWYEHEDGGYTQSNWELINGNWYWFDESGYRVVGWKNINGSEFYFNEEGIMVSNCWQQYGEKWYYLGEDGAMVTTAWRQMDGKWYYFNAAGEWVNDNTAEAGSLKGIDVSKYQGEIDWTAVKNSGVQFAMVRVGHGERTTDTYFEKNMQGANAVGIPVGVYFYSTASSVEQAILDAQFVINSLNGYTVSYPVAIDIEDRTQRDPAKAGLNTAIVNAFSDEIRAAGYTPMVYCDESFYEKCLDRSQLGNIEKWIARYSYTYNSEFSREIWQCSSRGRVAGIKGNVDIDFGYKDYTTTIVSRTSADAGYVPTKGMWRQNATGWWYEYLTGGYAKNCWELIHGNWYWFDDFGYMTTGWQYINNKWYYMDENGAMQTGWQYVRDVWYYMDGNGAMQTGWVLSGNLWYYMNGSGAMTTGWQYINGTWYYLNKSGAMLTDWQKIDGTWYYMDENGAMASNTWIGNYYVDASGAWTKTRTSGEWIKSGNRWWYRHSDGSYTSSGWEQINGIWYYFDAAGWMTTGWQLVNGTWYYMDDNGAMAADKWIGKYYVNSYGAWVATR